MWLSLDGKAVKAAIRESSQSTAALLRRLPTRSLLILGSMKKYDFEHERKDRDGTAISVIDERCKL
jgi:hypothetical protein